MKKLLLASCFLSILLMGVKCDDEFPKEPTLPPATRTGENTFGCLVNGEVFTDYAIPFSPALTSSYNNGSLQVRAIYKNSKEILIRLKDVEEPKVYSLDSSMGNYVYYYDQKKVNCYGRENPSYNGDIEITRLDTKNRIVSGHFNFSILQKDCPDVVATEGRFDVTY